MWFDVSVLLWEINGGKTGPNHDKAAHREIRKTFYDWLAQTITIDGVQKIERDTEFDKETYRSGGIRLYYTYTTGTKSDLKDGMLLEAGFDTVAPNFNKDISSWAYDYAASRVELIDNRALAVSCYQPGYTLVEKLQTISTKYPKQQESGKFPANFLRHYERAYERTSALYYHGRPSLKEILDRITIYAERL